MDTLLQDLRFAVRSLRRQRLMAAIAVLCLALGIGANTAIFSVVRAVLLESLPFREPDRLARVFETFSYQGSRGQGSVSVPNFLDWRSQNQAFESMAAYSVGSRNLVGNGEAERVKTVRASADLFKVLGAPPLLGRTFAPGEDGADATPVAVVSERFWRDRLGARREALGSVVTLDTTRFTVIGVMPASFDYPISATRTDLWIPLLFDPQQATSRGNHWMAVVARYRPGIDSTSATASMGTLAAQLARAYPREQGERGIEIVPLEQVAVGRVRPALLILLGAVGLVLVIACANVANLLLARAAGRRREVAIRTALGAGRSRLIRQLLTESILLGVAGALLGLLVARALLRVLLTLAAETLPRSEAVGLDAPVLAFTAAMAIVTGIAFGLFPALRASRADLRADLTEAAGRSTHTRRQHRTLDALVAAELALSLVLLVGAGLLMRGFVRLLDVDPGLRTENVLTFHTTVPVGRYADSANYTQFFGRIVERLAATPGVRSASLTNILPIQSWGMNGSFRIEGRPEETDPARAPFAEFRLVGPDYFRTLGIALLRGREFATSDAAGAPPVVIINEDFARRYFPNEDPVGKRIFAWQDSASTIVGVARAVRQAGLDQEAKSELYVPAAQRPGWLSEATFVVATDRAPEALIGAAREAVRQVAPTQPVFQVQTMREVVEGSVRTRKLVLVLLAIFAGVAVLLSAIGVYGVMAYGVAQRTREIGIRMALGADRSSVTRMVLGHSARVTAVAVLVGLAGALAATRVLESMLFGVGTRDPLTFVIVPILLAGVALMATWLPARRAARVDPMIAIRQE